MCSSICRGVWQPGGAGTRLEEFQDLQDAATSWPGWAQCGGCHCQQDRIWNHHGNRSLDISVSEILKWIPELRRLTVTTAAPSHGLRSVTEKGESELHIGVHFFLLSYVNTVWQIISSPCCHDGLYPQTLPSFSHSCQVFWASNK